MCLSRHFHYSGFHQYTTVDSISPSFSKSGSKVGTLGGTAAELDKALSVEGFWLPVVKKSLEMSFPVTPSHMAHAQFLCVCLCVCVQTHNHSYGLAPSYNVPFIKTALQEQDADL